MSYLGLLWATLFRKKIRTFLTLFSVMVAFLLFGLLVSVAQVFTAGVEVAGADRLIVSPKYSIIDPLPISYQNQIRGIEGVLDVTHADWFGGHYQDPSNFFAKYPVDPRGYFRLYPELKISRQQLEAFANTRTGAVVSRKLADKYGWNIGDRIPIEGDIYPKKDGSRLWEFDLVGIYTVDEDQVDPQTFLFQRDYFEEAAQFGQGTVGWFIVRIEDPQRAPEISQRIDKLFENSVNATRTATEAEFQKQFAKQLGDIGFIMTSILSAVFFTIVLLTGNTMAQSLRERISELAVLKTLGFTDLKVSLLVLGESVLLSVLGALLGLGLAALMSPGIAKSIENNLPGYQLYPVTIVAGIALAAGLGLLVGALPAFTAQRLKIVDALRRG